jgi:hypothetical protein
MSYRVTYQVNVDWVGPGTGPMGGNLAPALPQGGRGGAQTLEFSNPTSGSQAAALNSILFDNTAITALTNAVAAALVTQFTASQSRVQGFASGNG